jgi:hypothetical protein
MQPEKLYKESLDCLDKSLKTQSATTPNILHDCGLVFAAEHLAQIEFERGNQSTACSLQAQAKKIRAQNPHWAGIKSTDMDHSYIIESLFPSPEQEIIPTHFSLQDISSN